MRILAAIFVGCAAACAQTPAGMWDATLQVENRQVAFRLDVQRSGRGWTGAILDGDRRIESTSGTLSGNELKLRWDYFDAELTATLEDGRMQGAYARRTRAGVVRRAFAARPFRPAAAEQPAGTASVAGRWRLQTDAARGVRVMDGIFRQAGAEVSGTIQRVDGDFGTLTGKMTGNRLTLSHFDGIRATLIEAELKPDGTLAGTMDGQTRFTAARLDQAAKLGIPEPPDPSRFVAVKNPDEPLHFRFQDLGGKWVSSDDAEFRNKAMIVTIMGSWCPNCHDEADFLAELDRRYRGQGLEIVALGFEYTGEVERDRGQLRAFARRHNIGYRVLLAGTTEDGEVLRALPQLANFAGYPATLYLDRNHRVRAVHAGFAGPANPQEHEKLKAELERQVRDLLK
jgi:thiol-disulfide isomerase/thioredoxin